MSEDDGDDGGGVTQKETIDQPGIIGTRWWQESIATEVPRRKAIKTLLTFGGALTVIGAVGYLASRHKKTPTPSSSGASKTWNPDEATDSMKSALEMQRQFGWSFGAVDEPLVFDGTTTQPFDPASMDTMVTDLAPGNPAYTPYWVSTLFQSPSAVPFAKVPGDPTVQPLKSVMRPVATPSTELAFHRGKALATILAATPAKSKGVAIVVDLPGPDAVAFAAGAAGLYDPVFLFDNWPHPHGVVASHLTLGAALYYQPLFAKQRAQSVAAMPMFVLDRNRLATYVDAQREFDNRYTARIPSGDALKKLGVDDILYIGPTALEHTEADDLVDPFLLLVNGIQMKFHTCPAMAFSQASTADAGADVKWYYGGSAAKNAKFWTDWNQTPVITVIDEVMKYEPVPRKSAFSSGYQVPAATPQKPENFGAIPVIIALNNGTILGSRSSRNLPINWSSSGSSGSGNSSSSSSTWSSDRDRRSGSWGRTYGGSSS